MPRKPRVVVAAEDPGAANVLAPVASRLRADRRVELSIWALRQAREVFSRTGLYLKKTPSRAALLRRFRAFPPDLLLVGSSENPRSLDRLLTLEARHWSIPILSILDNWCNYLARYSGRRRSERLRYLPDLIFAMDASARREMVHAGIPRDRIRVVGQPHLEQFEERRRKVDLRRITAVRRSLGLRTGEILICFASETYGLRYDRSYGFRPLSGALERTIIILEHLLAAVGVLARTTRLKPVIINKIHPKNRPSEFEWVARLRLPFRVFTLHRADNDALVLAADLVVGMTSMFLLEATYLGANVLHVLPRPGEAALLQDIAQRNPVARNPRDLRRRLRELLVRPHSNRAAVLRRFASRHHGATGRIVRAIYDVLAARNAFTRQGP
jgi:hypothetical protein